MASPPRRSLMHNLGAFVGHVIRGIRTDPAAGGSGRERRVVRQDVQEETRDTPEGRVTLRRTTIEEVEVERPPPPT
jgi:hypothetical protein